MKLIMDEMRGTGFSAPTSVFPSHDDSTVVPYSSLSTYCSCPSEQMGEDWKP
jgi:hypothetical protein